MQKVLALNEKGQLTPCSAPEEMRGKGRCNHIAHQNEGETYQEFMERADEVMSELGISFDNDAVPVPEVKPLFDFKRNGGDDPVNVKIKPYRMSQEELNKGLKVTRKTDFLIDYDDDRTVYMQTEEGKELWNEMDMNAFAEIHPKMSKKDILSVLLNENKMITKSNNDRFIPGMIYDEDLDELIFNRNEKIKEQARYSYLRENPEGTEEEVEDFIKNNVELIEVDKDTGVEAMNKVAKDFGFTATRNIPVLPYYMRPSTDAMDDQLTTGYQYMHRMRNNPDKMQYGYLSLLNNAALGENQRYDGGFARKSLADQFSGKGGIFRKYMSGRAVPYSGRAVIEPTLDVKYGEIILPARAAIDMYKPTVVQWFREHDKNDEEFEEFMQRFRPGDLNRRDVKDLENIIRSKDVRVLANRQPSSHTANLQSFEVKLTPEPTIFVHPLVDEGYGGDHDGDTMAIIGINASSMAEKVDRSMSARADINTRRDRKLDESQILPSKDLLFGIMSILKARSDK